MSNEIILSVEDLKTHFFLTEGIVHALDGINFKVFKGETLGIIGETGSGKTVTALSIMRLIMRPGKILAGNVFIGNENLMEKSNEEMRKIRGKKIAMIFQDPMTSLNPVMNVGEQVLEALRVHRNELEQKTKKRIEKGMHRHFERKRLIELFRKVGISNPEKRIKSYPHEFSGGMRQRVMIAMAIACNPELLIADEATTNLDVTVQAQVLELIKELRNEFKTSIILITHNLGVIAEMADMVAVMYAGQIKEYADVRTIFNNPRHPYTIALLKCFPRSSLDHFERFNVIPGRVPSLINPPSGCRFHPRCAYANTMCREKNPELIEISPSHKVACLLVRS